MSNPCQVSLETNGQDQVLTIPANFALSGTEVVLKKDGPRLIIEPVPATSLLDLLATLEDITDTFADIDEGLLPVNDITL